MIGKTGRGRQFPAQIRSFGIETAGGLVSPTVIIVVPVESLVLIAPCQRPVVAVGSKAASASLLIALTPVFPEFSRSGLAGRLVKTALIRRSGLDILRFFCGFDPRSRLAGRPVKTALIRRSGPGLSLSLSLRLRLSFRGRGPFGGFDHGSCRNCRSSFLGFIAHLILRAIFLAVFPEGLVAWFFARLSALRRRSVNRFGLNLRFCFAILRRSSGNGFRLGHRLRLRSGFGNFGFGRRSGF